MSVHVMSWVLKHSNARANDRLALLVFADHAGEQGEGSYPSLDTIAFEGRMNRSTAVAARKRLEADGRIVRDGTAPNGETPSYRVRMDVPAEGPPPTRRRTPEAKGGRKADPPETAQSKTPQGSEIEPKGGRTVQPEPSKEPPKTREKCAGTIDLGTEEAVLESLGRLADTEDLTLNERAVMAVCARHPDLDLAAEAEALANHSRDHWRADVAAAFAAWLDQAEAKRWRATRKRSRPAHRKPPTDSRYSAQLRRWSGERAHRNVRSEGEG